MASADGRRRFDKGRSEISDTRTKSPSVSELELDPAIYIRELMKPLLRFVPANQNAPVAPMSPSGLPNLLGVHTEQPRKTPPPASSQSSSIGLPTLLRVPEEQQRKTPPPASSRSSSIGLPTLLRVPEERQRKTPPPVSSQRLPMSQPSIVESPGKTPKRPSIREKPHKGSRKESKPPPCPPKRPLPALPSVSPKRYSDISSAIRQRLLGQYSSDKRGQSAALPGHLLLLHLQLKSSILEMEVTRSEEENAVQLPVSKDEAAKEKKQRVAESDTVKPTKRPSKRTIAELEAELYQKVPKQISVSSEQNTPQPQSQRQLLQQSTRRPDDEGVYMVPGAFREAANPVDPKQPSSKQTGSIAKATENFRGVPKSKPKNSNSVISKSQSCHHVWSQAASAASVPSRSVRIRGRLS